MHVTSSGINSLIAILFRLAMTSAGLALVVTIRIKTVRHATRQQQDLIQNTEDKHYHTTSYQPTCAGSTMTLVWPGSTLPTLRNCTGQKIIGIGCTSRTIKLLAVNGDDAHHGERVVKLLRYLPRQMAQRN